MSFLRAVGSGLILSLLTSAILPPQAIAQGMVLPAPGAMVFTSQASAPVTIKGLKVHPENPFLFEFILDAGKSGLPIDSPGFRTESQKLIRYFLAALAIKEDDLWVNLSPYEKDRMTSADLGRTELGRDMLGQDYLLKQLTASLIYPDKGLGKTFWDRIYTLAREQFGTIDIPVDTFNKVWIMADKARAVECHNGVYVTAAHLKVMLEEDYVALGHQTAVSTRVDATPNKAHALASQVVREIIIPEIEKEVNTGETFAPLRQLFYAMILATWYKSALKESLINQVYANQGKVGGVLNDDPLEKDKIYARYLEAYRKGVFNYIKDTPEGTGNVIPRKYFSGGIPRNLGIRSIDHAQELTSADRAAARGEGQQCTMLVTFQGVRNRQNDKAASTQEMVERLWELSDLRFDGLRTLHSGNPFFDLLAEIRKIPFDGLPVFGAQPPGISERQHFSQWLAAIDQNYNEVWFRGQFLDLFPDGLRREERTWLFIGQRDVSIRDIWPWGALGALFPFTGLILSRGSINPYAFLGLIVAGGSSGYGLAYRLYWLKNTHPDQYDRFFSYKLPSWTVTIDKERIPVSQISLFLAMGVIGGLLEGIVIGSFTSGLDTIKQHVSQNTAILHTFTKASLYGAVMSIPVGIVLKPYLMQGGDISTPAAMAVVLGTTLIGGVTGGGAYGMKAVRKAMAQRAELRKSRSAKQDNGLDQAQEEARDHLIIDGKDRGIIQDRNERDLVETFGKSYRIDSYWLGKETYHILVPRSVDESGTEEILKDEKVFIVEKDSKGKELKRTGRNILVAAFKTRRLFSFSTFSISSIVPEGPIPAPVTKRTSSIPPTQYHSTSFRSVILWVLASCTAASVWNLYLVITAPWRFVANWFSWNEIPAWDMLWRVELLSVFIGAGVAYFLTALKNTNVEIRGVRIPLFEPVKGAMLFALISVLPIVVLFFQSVFDFWSLTWTNLWELSWSNLWKLSWSVPWKQMQATLVTWAGVGAFINGALYYVRHKEVQIAGGKLALSELEKVAWTGAIAGIFINGIFYENPLLNPLNWVDFMSRWPFFLIELACAAGMVFIRIMTHIAQQKELQFARRSVSLGELGFDFVAGAVIGGFGALMMGAPFAEIIVPFVVSAKVAYYIAVAVLVLGGGIVGGGLGYLLYSRKVDSDRAMEQSTKSSSGNVMHQSRDENATLRDDSMLVAGYVGGLCGAVAAGVMNYQYFKGQRWPRPRILDIWAGFVFFGALVKVVMDFDGLGAISAAERIAEFYGLGGSLFALGVFGAYAVDGISFSYKGMGLRKGGIDLNAGGMELKVERDENMRILPADPAIIQEFRQGNFTGVEGIILKIIPVNNPLLLLGFDA